MCLIGAAPVIAQLGFKTCGENQTPNDLFFKVENISVSKSKELSQGDKICVVSNATTTVEVLEFAESVTECEMSLDIGSSAGLTAYDRYESCSWERTKTVAATNWTLKIV